MTLPEDIDYDGLSGLSSEMRQKFATVRPRSLGQAGRIEGVTPAALALVAVHARRAGRRATPNAVAAKTK
jgi:tRNA uridine 5-carboxymethylaminomethyl modification enzyme